MPMLMLKCKNCGEVFPGLYIPEDTKKGSKLNASSATPHDPDVILCGTNIVKEI